ncbi:MAG: hypothetical protein Q8R29_00920 [bacterium]|nr:hypothetical protein [bacterium]
MNNQEQKTCQSCKTTFSIEPEDFEFYEKVKVPSPTWCRLCRLQRRMSYHNERYLFRLKSNKSGKDIFSMYPPQAALTVWDREEWLADDWDQNAAGMQYDWNKPFLQQYRELMAKAPVPSRGIVQLVNSDYSNNGSYLKDSYLVFGSSYIENGAYLENSVRVKDSLDVSFVFDSELSYECFFNLKCYSALYSSYCKDCQNIYFCRDCNGCSDCFGCVGLRGKSHYIFNKPHSKEDYAKRIKKFGMESYAKREVLKKDISDLWLKYPVRCAKNYKNDNCTGEYITNSKNVHQSYYIDGAENIKYSHGLYVKPSSDSYDQYRYGDNSQLMYECALTGGHSANIKFSYHVYTNCRDIEYSWNCNNSSHLFGCIGLNKKQYCILNKQYSREEYGGLIPEIKKHMDDMPYTDNKGRVYKYGEFMPSEISPVAYNESVAKEYFQLSQEEALSRGFNWREANRKEYPITMVSSDLPDTISEVNDSIFSEVIRCEHFGTCNHECTGVIRIIPQELEIYKKLNVPIPHLCPNCRHAERITQRNTIKLFHRSCGCTGVVSSNRIYTNQYPHDHGSGQCPNEFETSYSPERGEIVYCEQCYQNEVI